MSSARLSDGRQFRNQPSPGRTGTSLDELRPEEEKPLPSDDDLDAQIQLLLWKKKERKSQKEREILKNMTLNELKHLI